MSEELQPQQNNEDLYFHPEWHEMSPPDFIEKATKPDGLTEKEFKERYLSKKDDKEKIRKYGTPEGEPNFKKMVDNYPTEVPESFMSDVERDKKFGAHPRTRHEIDRLEDPN